MLPLYSVGSKDIWSMKKSHEIIYCYTLLLNYFISIFTLKRVILFNWSLLYIQPETQKDIRHSLCTFWRQINRRDQIWKIFIPSVDKTNSKFQKIWWRHRSVNLPRCKHFFFVFVTTKSLVKSDLKNIDPFRSYCQTHFWWRHRSAQK